ncbi:hypothetical protein Ahy_B02g057596 isoform B [Arachis hypogaea]|uniref:Uncharacterized protein n=1 Tax=Arachis hypogaea TaxID=3818 RepID=A0A445ACT5_ARAHY|nr:hypothetical protein Ahy_B02g057596 isoform B [Arachis hypogaea]
MYSFIFLTNLYAFDLVAIVKCFILFVKVFLLPVPNLLAAADKESKIPLCHKSAQEHEVTSNGDSDLVEFTNGRYCPSDDQPPCCSAGEGSCVSNGARKDCTTGHAGVAIAFGYLCKC